MRRTPQLRTPEPATGADLAKWLESQGWDVWMASVHLHVPATTLISALAWPEQALPSIITRACHSATKTA